MKGEKGGFVERKGGDEKDEKKEAKEEKQRRGELASRRKGEKRNFKKSRWMKKV